MILDVLEALDVLATAIAVWIAAGCAAVTVAGWALAWIARTVWAAIRPREASTAPLAASQPSDAHSLLPNPGRAPAPHTPGWARAEQEAT